MPTFAEFADVNVIRVVLMVAGVTMAVVTDIRERRIPNKLTLPLAIAGLSVGAVSGGLLGLVLSLSGLLAGGLFFFLPAAKLGWGVGDLKLAAALGAIGGPMFIIWTGLYALVAGGLFALVWLKQQGRLAPVVSGMHGDLRVRQVPVARSGLSIPYAVPIAAGMVVALLISPGLPG